MISEFHGQSSNEDFLYEASKVWIIDDSCESGFLVIIQTEPNLLNGTQRERIEALT